MFEDGLFAVSLYLQYLVRETNTGHTFWMIKIKEPPEIAEIVRYFMPDASDDELKEATVNFRAYLAVLYRIFLRLEAEGRLHEIRDFPENNDKVIESKPD